MESKRTYVISYQWKDKPSITNTIFIQKERKSGAGHHVSSSADVLEAIDELAYEMKRQERKFSITSIFSEPCNSSK